ncbi:MAG: putative Eukaryotic initiation factor 4A [Streblomastix strix]|uniref:Putative Eukaryotic initiation factor 4A n=1 Tax=Streblomastix strix TaxID=222440 RepID=A0A5J4V4N8_9EUKA|nr:MAG: putative Eukaryotic initiation factor 4A [Streblomastix strix]
MLSAGFKDKIEDINRNLPQSSQTILLSATMPSEIHELIEKILRNPVRIIDPREEISLDGVRQFYVALEKEEYKEIVVMDLFERLQLASTLFFCNSRRKVDFLADLLQKQRFTVSKIHGGMEMPERNQMMKDFREGRSRVLITHDLLLRGIEIRQVLIVMNYDVPTEKEQYIHRIGRLSQFDKKGSVINLASVSSRLQTSLLFAWTQLEFYRQMQGLKFFMQG